MPPSVRHEAVLLLLRARPALLVELLRRASGLDLPGVETVTFASESVRELAPIELRADAVIAFGREEDGPIAIFEVQLAPDGEKRLAWPVYVAVVHRETGRPVLLVVLALDEETARWSREPIAIGPGATIVPYVIGPAAVPRIVDPEVARENVELAVLSALAHGRDAGGPEVAARIAVATLEAVAAEGSLDDDRREIYADVVLAALGAAARASLEGLMQKGSYEFQSDFARHYIAVGREEGVALGEARGVALGEARGVALGEARGEARALLAMIRARGIELSQQREEAIRACGDPATLEAWVVRAAVATSEREIFGDD
jgi:hypothetical protein